MEPYARQVAQWLSEDPDLPGVEILRRARLAGYRGGKTALYELAEAEEEALANGAFAFLAKPVNLAELDRYVVLALESRKDRPI